MEAESILVTAGSLGQVTWLETHHKSLNLPSDSISSPTMLTGLASEHHPDNGLARGVRSGKQ